VKLVRFSVHYLVHSNHHNTGYGDGSGYGYGSRYGNGDGDGNNNKLITYYEVASDSI
jgi:hypothetical protein